MNSFGTLKIYPRGFLGATRPPMLLKKSGNNRNQRLQYDNTLFDTNDSKIVVANPDIDNLYQRMIRGEGDTRRFAFREEILQQVLWAFGTSDFEGWFKAQYNSPSFGTDHRDFLDDCLGFLMTGVRRVQLNTWDAILDSTDSRCQEDTLAENSRSFFNKEFVSNLAPTGRYQLIDVVQQWCMQPSGINDLLFTTHILFGIKR